MKILVCGDRYWSNRAYLEGILDGLHKEYGPYTIIEGEARGADRMAGDFGMKRGLPVEPYPAEWNTYGRSAGPIRNAKMLKEGKPDLVVAFHNHLGQSKGTRHMLEIAHKAGVSVMLFTENGRAALV